MNATEPKAEPSPGKVRRSSRRRRAQAGRKPFWRVVLWGAVTVGVAWIAVAMVLFLGDDEPESVPARLQEVTARAGGCEPADFHADPGEGVLLRVLNETDTAFEVIVTDEAGVALRSAPNYDPDEPVNSAAGRSRVLAAGLLAHDGHDEEAGPDATADFRYRLLVSAGSNRVMRVTFPEIGEFDPLTRLVCAAVLPDGSLDPSMPIGRITAKSA